MATYNQAIFNPDFNTTYTDGLGVGKGSTLLKDGGNNFLTLGAPFKKFSTIFNNGNIYNYKMIGGKWIQQQVINPPNGNLGGYFGISTNLIGKTANLSASNFFLIASEPIAANLSIPNKFGYVYAYNAINFASLSRYQTLESPRSAPTGYFGHSISLSSTPTNTYVLITERSTATVPGSAWVYSVATDNKTLTSPLPLRCHSSTQGKFGYDSAWYEDLIVVTDNTRTESTLTETGTAFVYTFNPSSPATGLLTSTALNRSSKASNQNFGTSISFNHNVLAIGAPGQTVSDGKVYLYRKNGINLTETNVLTPPAPWNNKSQYFGYSVDVSQINPSTPNIVNIFVGCPNLNNGLPQRGGAFVYNYNLTTDTATLNNTIGLSFGESPSAPGNQFGTTIHASPDYTVIAASNTTGALLPVSAASLSYSYNGLDVLNTDGIDTFTSATVVTQPYAFTNSVTAFAPSTLAAADGDQIFIPTQYTGNPAPTYNWLKNGTFIPGATDRVYTFIGNLTDDGFYSVSAFNAVNTYLNNTVTSNSIYVDVQSSAVAGNNTTLPSAGFLSIAGYGAGSPNLYRSINQFLRNYSGIDTNSANSSLNTRENNAMALDQKPATNVGSFASSPSVVVLLNELEMGTITVAGIGTKPNWTPTGTGGTFRPARISEFRGAYKWFSPWFTNSYASNSNPGCTNCAGTDRTNKGTVIVTGVSNMVTSTFYVKITPATGGIPSGWQIASPSVTYNNVVNNGSVQAYNIWIVDSNGYGINENVAPLTRAFNATYP